jgi:hypothetical protein
MREISAACNPATSFRPRIFNADGLLLKAMTSGGSLFFIVSYLIMGGEQFGNVIS